MYRPLTLLLALLAACDTTTPSSESASPLRESGQDEASAYAADLVFFTARREAFERDGTVPTVPPSLSGDPRDPAYRFLGYRDLATAAEDEEHRLRLESTPPTAPGPEEARAENAPIRDGETVALFVNDVGETWSWTPTDIEGRLAARRRERGHTDLRSVDDSELEPALVEAESARAVLGGDGRAMRSAWSGHDLTGFPWRVIGSLETDGKPQDQSPLGRCTASKLGERYLLTAAHCVFTSGDGEGSLTRRDWWPGGDGIDDVAGGGDPTPNGAKNIQWYAYDAKFVDDGWETRDYAVLVLYDNDSSCASGALGYRVDGSLAGTDHWNFGYPWHEKTCPPSSPLASDDCGGSMWGMEAEIDTTSASYVFFDHDTDEGQSGSPIYDYNGGNRQIVAHVKGGWTGVDNRGVKMNDRLFDFVEAVRDEQPSDVCTY